MSILDNSYISFVNLESRKDRLNHMHTELKRVGIQAIRQQGYLPQEIINKSQSPEKYNVMMNRTPGALGCHMSQVQIMKYAKSLNLHALVMEDDIVFCSDFHDRMAIITEFTNNNEWDIIWLGSSFHVNPPYWHRKGKSGMPPDCSAQLGYDAKLIGHERIIQTFGAFATFAYIVNVKSIDKILNLFDKHIHESIGIDWLMMKIQPQLKTFAFLPGCVRQIDNMSNIGSGMTIWSGFLKLNGTFENSAYVYQDTMDQFNPSTFNWAECK